MSRTTRVQVLLEGNEAERFDEYCRDRGFKKSTLIARLVKEHLDKEAFYPQRALFTPPALRKARR